ncbi:MAG TPA: pseudouridine synthase [Burkholderiaceae bacterium]|nr:pseudouridine synthase [Burkholderiaceae bacterium]
MHVDAHCIVVCKPSGLLAVPGRGEAGRDCLSERVRGEYPDALIVHRLDMATSGLMLLARGADAQRTLGNAFARREVHKRYVAIVAGPLSASAGEIDLPLSADWPNRPRQQVDKLRGKPSLTRYRVLELDLAKNTTRVELEPVTGRAHQLRVHLLAIGHPILGDALYGSAEIQAAAPRLLLHAAALRFAHPASGEPMSFDSPPPF